MSRVVGYYTKGGKVRPITSKKPLSLKFPPLTNTTRVVGYHTKGGEKIIVTSKKPSLLKSLRVNNTTRHTISSRTLQKGIIQKRILLKRIQKKPWEKGWKKPLYKTKHYSFKIAKKDDVIDYYIEVNHNGKKFMSIPLKPLIQRGIGYGLTAITGFPVDVGSLEVIIQKATSEYGLDKLMQSI